MFVNPDLFKLSQIVNLDIIDADCRLHEGRRYLKIELEFKYR